MIGFVILTFDLQSDKGYKMENEGLPDAGAAIKYNVKVKLECIFKNIIFVGSLVTDIKCYILYSWNIQRVACECFDAVWKF